MRARGLVRLAGLELAADPRGALLNGAATCAGAAALVFFVALGLGVGQGVRRMFPGDARLLEVVPSAVSLGPVLGGGQLGEEALARLRALPGAVDAWPKLNLRVPIAAGKPEGLDVSYPQGMTVQIPGLGVPRGLVSQDLGPGQPFEDPGEGGGPIPVVISKRLLEIYNKTIAPSWNVRRLPPGKALVGLQVPVRVGYSIVPLKTEDRVYDARLVLAGLSDRVPIHAAAMPLETVQRLNRAYGKADPGYSAVALLAARPDDVPAIAAAVRRMGFAVDEGERGLSERVGAIVAVTTGALALLALLMCGLAALAIAQSLFASVRGRSRDIAILQAVGATAADVRALFLAEAGLTGLAGGALGVALARLAAAGVDRWVLGALPDFPSRPETLFAFPPWLYLAGVGVAALSAILGALAPAAAAARLDPARAIA